MGYFPGIVRAHGGGVPQLTNAGAGPYWVSVWTQPDPLRVGKAHFTVAVSQPPDGTKEEAGAPVLGAIVELQLKPLDSSGKTLIAQATHQTAVNKLFYEADVELPAEGRWQTTILVQGPAGSGEAYFEFEALPPSIFKWWTLLGGSLLVVAVAGWLVLKSPDEKQDAPQAGGLGG